MSIFLDPLPMPKKQLAHAHALALAKKQLALAHALALAQKSTYVSFLPTI